jgi:hypothetical protein
MEHFLPASARRFKVDFGAKRPPPSALGDLHLVAALLQAPADGCAVGDEARVLLGLGAFGQIVGVLQRAQGAQLRYNAGTAESSCSRSGPPGCTSHGSGASHDYRVLSWYQGTTRHPEHWPPDVGNYWVEARRRREELDRCGTDGPVGRPARRQCLAPPGRT